MVGLASVDVDELALPMPATQRIKASVMTTWIRRKSLVTRMGEAWGLIQSALATKEG